MNNIDYVSDEQGKTPAEIIDERELRKRLPISRRTIYNLRVAGKIPSIKLGHRTLYDWQSVRNALLRLQKGGNP
jgi:predicted DNA-binding transcriptional regulator AlpA